MADNHAVTATQNILFQFPYPLAEILIMYVVLFQ